MPHGERGTMTPLPDALDVKYVESLRLELRALIVEAILESTHPIAHNSIDVHRIESLVDDLCEIIAVEAIALKENTGNLQTQERGTDGDIKPNSTGLRRERAFNRAT